MPPSTFARSLLLAALLSCACGACNLIYKQNIQQGNALEQEDLDQIYLGMNKRQVLFVLGSPSIRDPFHQDRWDYVQTFSRRGGDMVQRTVTLKFENDALTEMIGIDDPFGEAEGEADKAPAKVVKSGAAPEEANPHTAAVESAKDEVLEPEIQGLPEPTAEERELEERMEVLEQVNPEDPTSPDIDG